MKSRKLIAKVLIIFFCLTPLMISPKTTEVNAFSNQVIQKGAVGEDVIELQPRLQYLGFYNKRIDGVFGWSTYWALRNFQYEFGLPIDGLAGSKTKAKLVKASKYDKQHVKREMYKDKKFKYYGKTKNKQQTSTAKPIAANTPHGFSQNDIQIMANAVYGEARGEPYEGQVAVAAVILNRLNSSTFPNTVSGVIFEPRAFTAVADGQIWLTPNDTARKAVLDAINGWDPTGNALYYFNPETATSDWIWTRPQIKTIGKHIFCK